MNVAGCTCPQGSTLYTRQDGASATCCPVVFEGIRREFEKVQARTPPLFGHVPLYDNPAPLLRPAPSFLDWLRSPLSDDDYFAAFGFGRSTVPDRLQGAHIPGMKPALVPPTPPAPPAAAASPVESDEEAIRRLFHLGPKDGTYDWREAFLAAGLAPQDCRAVLCDEEGANDSDSWLAILWLKDGRFAFLSAWCDYTGWDCQAGGDHHICDELSDLLLGFVGEQDARRLQVAMPAGKAAA